MKKHATTIVMILLLSLSIWVIFYILTPSAPLSMAETLVMVGFSAIIVISLKWFYNTLFQKEG